MNNIIEIHNLTKKFKNKLVFKNINLNIYKGEIFGLLGPNGAGKSVLIQILLGLIQPSDGNIKILGRDLQKNMSWIHQRINMASSYSQLQEDITIKENLLTFAGLYNIDNPQNKIFEITSFFGLRELINQNVKVMYLSAGEKTRLMLCKALINNPEVLFLDEPTGSLDPSISKKVHDLILSIHKKKKITIVYCSHNLIEVKNLCQRVGFLKDNKLINVVPIKDIYKVANMY